MRLAAPVSREYVRRNGLTVLHGPFAGMEYIDGLEDTVGDLIAKLTGVYERELHQVVSEWIAAGFAHVVDVGSAEGYYAVGFAHAMPRTVVHAYDISAVARERCLEMAERNGVQARLQMGGFCGHSDLEALPEEGVALLSDCEGGELELLDPARAERLHGWPILVELHDFVDPSITQTICERFTDSHDIQIIEMEDRGEAPAEMDFATSAQKAMILKERPPGMRWAHLWPRRLPRVI